MRWLNSVGRIRMVYKRVMSRIGGIINEMNNRTFVKERQNQQLDSEICKINSE